MERVEQALASAIQNARQAAGLTQQELCVRANLSYSTLAKIERGAIKTPSVFTVARIASVLGVSLDSLLGGTAFQLAPKNTKRKSKSGLSFVYVDINGCLVHFFHGAFSKIAQDYGVSSDMVETTFWHFNDAVCRGDIDMPTFNRQFAKQLGIPSIDWSAYYLNALEAVSGMHELVSWIGENYRVGLLSNIMPGQIQALIQKKLLPNIGYDVIIDSSQVHSIKPEPLIYTIATERAGVAPQEILFIDDSRTNVMAAEQQGWRVMWFDGLSPKISIDKIRTTLE